MRADVATLTPAETRCGPARARAFTLIEIMITVALLSFIVLGLLAMFQQTQRAFRSSITQTDVLEAGRAVTDLVVRELEQAAPCHLPTRFLPNQTIYATNLFAELTPGMPIAVYQDLPGATGLRTNLLQRFFFLSCENQKWTGTGYEVLPEYGSVGVGVLYRISADLPSYQAAQAGLLSSNFQVAAYISRMNALRKLPVTNIPGMAYVTRVADGIAHLRLQGFATNGFPITTNGFGNPGYGFFVPNPGNQANPFTFVRMEGTMVYPNPFNPYQQAMYLVGDAIPANVELELGILEPQILQRFKSLANAAAQAQYFSNHSAQVHLFRQRIPLRNFDVSAYQ